MHSEMYRQTDVCVLKLNIESRCFCLRILGIDPGYAILGWGVIDVEGNKFKDVAHGAITTEAGEEMTDRLKTLYNELMDVLAQYEPDEVSIEELFFNTNNKTAIFVAQARGVAILACVNSGVPVFEYTPLQIKQALSGYGRADKKQMQQLVKMMLNLNEIPKPDDTADAMAAAICHGNTANSRKRIDKYL